MLAESFDSQAFQAPAIEPSEEQMPSLVDVTLRFEPHAAYRVYDEFNEHYITKAGDGSFTVAIRLPNDFWLYDYLLSFGAAVEVIEPQHVRKEIVRRAESIKDKYVSKT